MRSFQVCAYYICDACVVYTVYNGNMMINGGKGVEGITISVEVDEYNGLGLFNT